LKAYTGFATVLVDDRYIPVLGNERIGGTANMSESILAAQLPQGTRTTSGLRSFFNLPSAANLSITQKQIAPATTMIKAPTNTERRSSALSPGSNAD
jgi:hypothetical protein